MSPKPCQVTCWKDVTQQHLKHSRFKVRQGLKANDRIFLPFARSHIPLSSNFISQFSNTSHLFPKWASTTARGSALLNSLPDAFFFLKVVFVFRIHIFTSWILKHSHSKTSYSIPRASEVHVVGEKEHQAYVSNPYLEGRTSPFAQFS